MPGSAQNDWLHPKAEYLVPDVTGACKLVLWEEKVRFAIKPVLFFNNYGKSIKIISFNLSS